MESDTYPSRTSLYKLTYSREVLPQLKEGDNF